MSRDEDWVSAADIARQLGVSRQAVASFDRILNPRRITDDSGRCLRKYYSAAAVRAFVEARTLARRADGAR